MSSSPQTFLLIAFMLSVLAPIVVSCLLLKQIEDYESDDCHDYRFQYPYILGIGTIVLQLLILGYQISRSVPMVKATS